MYKMSYAEVMAASPHEARARERLAFDHAIALMSAAGAKDAAAGATNEAVAYVQRLWTFFIESLSDPGNALGTPLKRDLISIGLWAIAESGRILEDTSRGFDALITVNKTIRDGLA